MQTSRGRVAVVSVGSFGVDLGKPPARPLQALATSPSQVTMTPKGTTPIVRQVDLGGDEEVEDYLDVEIDAGRVRGEPARQLIAN